MATVPKGMMRAAVMHAAGGPEVLKVLSWPIPTPNNGEVLIRVKAFGLNRSEMYTRQGHSPGITFPRVLGIEAVGLVEAAPGDEFCKNDVVATAMGGMGRAFDGGYAEYTCVPANQVKRITTNIPWEDLGALPELAQTTWGSLFTSLRLEKDDHLLIRGGTTSIGLAAAAFAKGRCAFIGVTTRNPDRENFLHSNGADEVYIETGSIAEEVRRKHPTGFSKVLELVGVTTLKDSCQCVNPNGIVCVTGIAGGKWSLENFNPFEIIPTSVGLTVYSGNSERFMETPVDEIAQQVVDGKIRIPTKVYQLDQIVEAHRTMEDSTACGKIVILT
jgi:NADPH:quinone reductase-like Zn-dependent oxidoreductase